MNKITIDGAEYELEELSVECKAQIESIQFVDSQLALLKGKAAALQTAKNAYVNALRHLLDDSNADDQRESEPPVLPEMINFD